jgi:uncharacterized protein (DUF58 family)
MKKKSSYGVFTILILLISAYVFSKFQGGFVSWFLFYSFLPIAVFSLLQFFVVLRGVTVERVIEKQKYTAGERIDVIIRVKNPYRFPLFFVVLKDGIDSRLRMEAEGYSKIAYPGFKKEFTIEYKINHLPRGLFRWDEITLETGDLFGFIKREKTYTQVDEIVVYPSYQQIRSWRTFNEKNIGMSYSTNRQDEDVSAVMGIRDYAPGDRLASIHWKASARTNSLKTKEFEHQVTNDFMFFIDREKLSYGDEEHPLFEKAVSLTASLIRFALNHHFSSGLVSYGEQQPTVMTMSRDQEQLYRVFEHLARIKADTTLSFVKTVLKEVVYLPTGTTVVLISPSITKKLAMMMGDLTYRKIKVEFFWIKAVQKTTEDEKESLTLLDQLQVSYHVVAGENFSDTLSGGERHVTA